MKPFAIALMILSLFFPVVLRAEEKQEKIWEGILRGDTANRELFIGDRVLRIDVRRILDGEPLPKPTPRNPVAKNVPTLPAYEYYGRIDRSCESTGWHLEQRKFSFYASNARGTHECLYLKGTGGVRLIFQTQFRGM
jgi:hypothetical protein